MQRSDALVELLINRRSGVSGNDCVAERAAKALQGHGMRTRIHLVGSSSELLKACRRVAAGDADIVVAGGGDGTIAAAAGGLLHTQKPLGILPLGTFNYFAREIGVPLDVDAAIDVIASGTVERATVGEVNGRVFLNNSSVGLYPTVLEQRETTYRRFGRSRLASYASVGRVIAQQPALMNLRMTLDGNELSRRTPLLFIGTNQHQLASFGVPGHECPEKGRMAIYVARPLTTGQLWRLAARALVRGLHGAEELEIACARELRVAMRPRRVRMALDGETVILETPLHYQLRDAALRVLVPATPADAGP